MIYPVIYCWYRIAMRFHTDRYITGPGGTVCCEKRPIPSDAIPHGDYAQIPVVFMGYVFVPRSGAGLYACEYYVIPFILDASIHFSLYVGRISRGDIGGRPTQDLLSFFVGFSSFRPPFFAACRIFYHESCLAVPFHRRP